MKTLYEVVCGSRAYGTDTPESDIDIRGVVVPPLEYFFGFSCHFEQQEHKDQEGNDSVHYDIRKFMKLAADANPNILELLFVPEDCIRIIDETFRPILENRNLFLSNKAKKTYIGYAKSQLKKMNPEQVDYDDTIVTWPTYNKKNAMHLIRLLRTGLELVSSGELHVHRPDAKELLEIRNGNWSYEQLIEHSRFLENEINKQESVLPDKPDMRALNLLCMECISENLHISVDIVREDVWNRNVDHYLEERKNK